MKNVIFIMKIISLILNYQEHKSNNPRVNSKYLSPNNDQIVIAMIQDPFKQFYHEMKSLRQLILPLGRLKTRIQYLKFFNNGGFHYQQQMEFLEFFETVGCICTKVFPIINRLSVFKLENSLELRNIKFLKLSGKSVFGLSVFVLKLFYFNSQNFPEHGLLDCWRRCCNCLSSHASTDLCAPATNTILGTCINLL